MSTTAPTTASDDAERTARHIRLAREMGELAMDLARAATARAKRDLEAAAPPQTTAETAKPISRNAADPTLPFTRLCRIIQTAIALEARLAAGLIPVIPKPRPAAAAAPLAQANQLSRTAAALAASTSLSTPVIPSWQPKPAASNPVVTAPALPTQLPGLPKASLNGTAPTLATG